MKLKKFLTSASLVLLAVVGMFCFVGCDGDPVEPAEVQAYMETADMDTLSNGFTMTYTIRSEEGNMDANCTLLASEEDIQMAMNVNMKSGDTNVNAKMYVVDGVSYYQMGNIKYKENGVSTEIEGVDFDPGTSLMMVENMLESLLATPEAEGENVSYKKSGDVEKGNVKFTISATAEEENVSAKMVLRFEANKLVEVSLDYDFMGSKINMVIKSANTVSLPSATELANWGTVA